MKSEITIPQPKTLPVAYCGDPLALYSAIADKTARNTLLLESSEIETHAGTQSIIIADASLRVVCRGTSVSVEALTANGAAAFPLLQENAASPAGILSGASVEKVSATELVFSFPQMDFLQDEDTRLKAKSPLDVLRALKNLPGFPAAKIFLGGIFGYDLVEVFEKLPSVPEGANTCPNFVFYLAETFATINHKTRSATVDSLILCDDAGERARIEKRAAQIQKICAELKPQKISLPPKSGSIVADVNKSDAVYGKEIEDLKAYIRKGDIFQVVPARRFSLPCPNPELAYRALRASNPSPYMFLVDDRDFTVFGASPEISVKFDAATRRVELSPIAGTRKRGLNADGTVNFDLDSRIEFDLRQDKKELSEHLMLVDLARNDLARIAETNSRHTSALLKVDRYSHVMHLVSHVVATLRSDLDALHAYQACMNMGTLTGAPKIRASELIRQVEGERRGSYGGAVGYICGNGDMDTCILIRSAFVTRSGTAIVQAGGGVVADSNPLSEADESRNKAAAPLSAIAAAQGKVLLNATH